MTSTSPPSARRRKNCRILREHLARAKGGGGRYSASVRPEFKAQYRTFSAVMQLRSLRRRGRPHAGIRIRVWEESPFFDGMTLLLLHSPDHGARVLGMFEIRSRPIHSPADRPASVPSESAVEHGSRRRFHSYCWCAQRKPRGDDARNSPPPLRTSLARDEGAGRALSAREVGTSRRLMNTRSRHSARNPAARITAPARHAIGPPWTLCWRPR